MATYVFRGDAIAVAQVDSLTPGGTIEVGDKFIVTINTKSVTYSATGTTVASVCTGLAAALTASTITEFTEITWTNITTAVTATSKTAGVPFVLTVSTTESDNSPADAQTFVRAAVTANDGPNVWSAANFGGTLPANTDTVILENSNVSILYNLDQSAVTLTQLLIRASYTGDVGLSKSNAAGYLEYRPDYLKVGASTLSIGAGLGDGSPRIKIDTGSVQTTVDVYLTALSGEPGLEAFLWKGTHASNVVNVIKGSAGLAVFGGETATVVLLRVGYLENKLTDAEVRCGSGVTLATVDKTGGILTTNSNLTTASQTDGTWTIAAGTVGTLLCDGGVVYYTSTGTCAIAAVSDGGTLDFSRDMRPRTITSFTIFSGGVVLDPHKSATLSNGIILERCSLADVTLDLGTDWTLVRI